MQLKAPPMKMPRAPAPGSRRAGDEAEMAINRGGVSSSGGHPGSSPQKREKPYGMAVDMRSS
jgi:hypothetical protein